MSRCNYNRVDPVSANSGADQMLLLSLLRLLPSGR